MAELEIKDKIDVVRTKIEAVKIKILGFVAIAGGSRIYTVNKEMLLVIKFGAAMIFLMASYGIANNFINLSKFIKELEELKI